MSGMFTGQRMRGSLGVSDTHRVGTSMEHRAEGEAWPTLLEAGVCFDVAIACGRETQKSAGSATPTTPQGARWPPASDRAASQVSLTLTAPVS